MTGGVNPDNQWHNDDNEFSEVNLPSTSEKKGSFSPMRALEGKTIHIDLGTEDMGRYFMRLADHIEKNAAEIDKTFNFAQRHIIYAGNPAEKSLIRWAGRLKKIAQWLVDNADIETRYPAYCLRSGCIAATVKNGDLTDMHVNWGQLGISIFSLAQNLEKDIMQDEEWEIPFELDFSALQDPQRPDLKFDLSSIAAFGEALIIRTNKLPVNFSSILPKEVSQAVPFFVDPNTET